MEKFSDFISISQAAYFPNFFDHIIVGVVVEMIENHVDYLEELTKHHCLEHRIFLVLLFDILKLPKKKGAKVAELNYENDQNLLIQTIFLKCLVSKFTLHLIYVYKVVRKE